MPLLWATFCIHNLQVAQAPLTSFLLSSFSKPKCFQTMEVRLDGDTTEWDAESIFALVTKICTCAQFTQWRLFETGKPTECLEPVKKLVYHNRFTALDEAMKWSSCCSRRYKIKHQYTKYIIHIVHILTQWLCFLDCLQF